MSIIINRKTIVTDKDGYLTNINDWDETVAQKIAEDEKLNLSNDHWLAIRFLRHFYLTYETMPTVRLLVKELSKILPEKKGNSIYLNQLFPQGLIKQSSKVAGLPKPKRCI